MYFSDNRRLTVEERYSLPEPGRLVISSVVKEDEAVYKCVLITLSGQRTESASRLNVIGN